MKKKLIFFCLSLIAFSACKNDPRYRIEGKITGNLDGKTVYLQKMENLRAAEAIDSAVIVNGAFTMKGSVPTPDLYHLSIAGSGYSLNLFVEDASIQIVIDENDLKNNIATGSPLNDLYNDFMKEMRENYQVKAQDIIQRAQYAQQNGEMTPEFEEQINKEYEQLMENYKTFQLKFISDNPGSIVSAVILYGIAGSLTFEELEEAVNVFDASISESQYITPLKENLEKMRKVAVGQMFTDIKALTPEGKEIALSDYAAKGKYVLIDFWASWCAPCRQENPNVVALYNQYKNKGFEIVGVSLDRDKEAWIKGIANDKITWPQMSDLKYWDSEGAKLYNIRSIPSTILLDKEGIIIAKDLRGKALEEKVAELIDSK